MTCALSRCTKLVTIIIFILPTQIECCSHTTHDMITLMAQDPNFRNNPCYIQWKADQDAKLDRFYAERDQFERSMAEYNRIREANRKQERIHRQTSYLSTNKVEIKKESPSDWEVLGIIAGIIVASVIAGVIIGMCCHSSSTSENDETTNNLQTNLNSGAASPVSMTINAEGNQTTPNVLLTTNDTNLILSETEGPRVPSSWETDTNMPLLPRGIIKRQDSLPSYDAAIKMPSAPPME